MKRKILLCLLLFLLMGCTMGNTPTSKVEDLFTKYQKVDNDIETGIDAILAEQNLTEAHKERYKKLLEKQYRNLSYEIKDEIIDGDKATVVTVIDVIDYKLAINDLTFDSSIYTKESFDEMKLDLLEEAKEKVTYTLELTLNKDSEGIWRLNALTNEQIKKIQGMY